MGRSQNLEPGHVGSAPGSDNLRYFDQVKLQTWALFSHLYSGRAGQDDLESSHPHFKSLVSDYSFNHTCCFCGLQKSLHLSVPPFPNLRQGGDSLPELLGKNSEEAL